MPGIQSDVINQKNLSVLITGGSGLVGKYLTSTLLTAGYKVSHLSRNAGQSGKVKIYGWDLQNKTLDPAIFDGVDYIVHLAGANIGERRWTKKRKEEIIKSRVESANLLNKAIKENGIRLKGFISASAIGYYGLATSGIIFSEEAPPSEDFLGYTCRLWEEAADIFGNQDTRVVKLRTGVVLAKNDSALSRMMIPLRFGLLVITGTGRQYMPWIHIKDLCNIYLKAIEDHEMTGVYNAVAPEHMFHADFMRTLAQVFNRPVWSVKVPAIVLRATLGEMSDVILKGSKVSAEKIIKAGYSFEFPALKDALNDVIYKLHDQAIWV
jgi:uncharacterized protein (TIGR01777 family)